MHANTRAFLKHYPLHHIDTNVQSVYRRLEPQAPLTRAITRMGRLIGTRRPRELIDN